MSTYHNPIIKGFHPDPSICQVGKDYYLVTSSFEFLPAIPLYHSQNLVNWTQIGHCLTNDYQINLHGTRNSGGIFAPTIRYHDGIFYLITTNISKGNFIVYTDNLQQGFSEPIWLDIKGVDPSLYFEDGRVYVQNACFDHTGSYIQQVEIDIKTGQLKENPVFISRGCGGRDVEAPHIYKINGYYYLLCAEGGTREGHMVTVQRSQSLYGPFEPCPYNPIVTNRNHSKEILQSVGHGDLFQDHQGEWWMVALATRPYKHCHHLGRETILIPVEWVDDWPVVKDGYAKMSYPISMEITQQETNSFYDDFNCEQLGYQYNMIRDFLLDQYQIESSVLRLYNNYETLDSQQSPVFIGVRQCEVDCCFETQLTHYGGNSGLALYIDHCHHMEIGLNKEKHLYLKKTVGDMKTMHVISYGQNTITIGIEANCNQYFFYYMNNNHQKEYIGSGLVKHLSVEMSDSPFTGVYCGMFIEETGFAEFEYFQYQEK